jgi:DNA-binding MltR family transcriptional regulator
MRKKRAAKIQPLEAKLEELATELDDVHDQLLNEGDRATALVGAARLETNLEQLLRRLLVDDAEIVDDLFGENRPLESFSSCIKMAFCLGLIGPELRKNLDVIRGIRNDFGHTHRKLSFNDDSIRDRCMNLAFVPSGRKATLTGTARERFVQTVTMIDFMITLISAPVSHRPIAEDSIRGQLDHAWEFFGDRWQRLFGREGSAEAGTGADEPPA